MNNWNPFFALANTRHKIDEAIESKQDESMRILTEDEFYEIQNVIIDSLENSAEIMIEYYEKKRYYEVVGVVTKVNVHNNYIVINNQKITVQMILRAEVI